MKVNELYIELTRRCNLKCAHCFYGDAQNADMSRETLEQIFQVYKDMDWLVAGGGEPFLNFDGVKIIIQNIMKQKIKVNNFFLATNGCCENMDKDEVIDLLLPLQNCNHTKFYLKLSDTIYHRACKSELEAEIYQSFKSKLDKYNIQYIEIKQDTEFINEGKAKANRIQPQSEQQGNFDDPNEIAACGIRDKVFKITCEGNIVAGCGHSYENAQRFIVAVLNKYELNPVQTKRSSGMKSVLPPPPSLDKMRSHSEWNEVE